MRVILDLEIVNCAGPSPDSGGKSATKHITTKAMPSARLADQFIPESSVYARLADEWKTDESERAITPVTCSAARFAMQ